MMQFFKATAFLVTTIVLCEICHLTTANEVHPEGSSPIASSEEELERSKRQSINRILTTLGSSVKNKEAPRQQQHTDEQQLSLMLQIAESIEILEKKIDEISPKNDAMLHKQHQTISKQVEIINKLNTLHKNMEADMDESIDMQSKIMDRINKLDATMGKLRQEIEQEVRSHQSHAENNQPSHQKGNVFIVEKEPPAAARQPPAKAKQPQATARLPPVTKHVIKEEEPTLLTAVEQDVVSEYSNQNTLAKYANGSTISRNQPDQPWIQQVGECGGVMVAEKGKIFFVGDENYGSDLRCVWTIRANRKSEVHIKLIEDDLGSNVITVTDYTDIYWNNNATFHSMKKKTAKLLAGDRALYVLDGPIVFVTLFYSRPAKYGAKMPPRFKLTFEGVGTDIAPEWIFNHYHIIQAEGAMKYPQEFGAHYLPNEVATIVLNPQPFPIHVNMSFYDFEREEDCNSDSLTYLTLESSSEPFFAPLGPPNQIKRFCGRNYVSARVGKTKWLQSLIAIIKSDQSNEFTGFRIVWSDRENLSPFHILQRWKA